MTRFHAIQLPSGCCHQSAENIIGASIGWPFSHAAQGEALGDVVAHEIDDDGAGDDGEHSRRRQQAQFIARRARRLRHRRGDGLGRDRRQVLGQQQLHPGEHEAEEAGDADAGRDGRDERS